MNRTIFFSMAVLLLAGGCGRAGGNLQRDQKQYEVVQEGQAGGVSSTIAAPGETSPPLMPMTGTNYDTTTAFTLDTTGTMTTTALPGTIAGTLPAQPTYRSYPSAPPRPQPATPPPTTTEAPEPAPPADQTAQPAEEKKDEGEREEEDQEDEEDEEDEDEPEQPAPPPPPG